MTLRLEVGKQYETAGGDVVRIVKDDGGSYMPFQCDQGYWRYADGRISCYGDCDLDLIREYTPEEVAAQNVAASESVLNVEIPESVSWTEVDYTKTPERIVVPTMLEQLSKETAENGVLAKDRLSTIRGLSRRYGHQKKLRIKAEQERDAISLMKDTLSDALIAEQAKVKQLRAELAYDKNDYYELLDDVDKEGRKQRRILQAEINRGDMWCYVALVLLAVLVGLAAVVFSVAM